MASIATSTSFSIPLEKSVALSESTGAGSWGIHEMAQVGLESGLLFGGEGEEAAARHAAWRERRRRLQQKRTLRKEKYLTMGHEHGRGLCSSDCSVCGGALFFSLL